MKINAVEFRANCFKILDQIKLTHKEVIITKRGKPIAKLTHIPQPEGKDPLFGSMEGLVETFGDLTDPVIAAEEWELD